MRERIYRDLIDGFIYTGSELFEIYSNFETVRYTMSYNDWVHSRIDSGTLEFLYLEC